MEAKMEVIGVNEMNVSLTSLRGNMILTLKKQNLPDAEEGNIYLMKLKRIRK